MTTINSESNSINMTTFQPSTVTDSQSGPKLVPDNDPILHNPATIVTEEQLTNGLHELAVVAKVLVDKIMTTNAFGISACQVGIDMAMFATYVDGDMRVCINPQIVAASVEMSRSPEACLSYPGLKLHVRRPAEVVVRYFNLEGKEITERLDGMHARVWLHEFDHVNGICFVDRVGKLSRQMAYKRRDKQIKRKKK